MLNSTRLLTQGKEPPPEVKNLIDISTQNLLNTELQIWTQWLLRVKL